MAISGPELTKEDWTRKFVAKPMRESWRLRRTFSMKDMMRSRDKAKQCEEAGPDYRSSPTPRRCGSFISTKNITCTRS